MNNPQLSEMFEQIFGGYLKSVEGVLNHEVENYNRINTFYKLELVEYGGKTCFLLTRNSDRKRVRMAIKNMPKRANQSEVAHLINKYTNQMKGKFNVK